MIASEGQWQVTPLRMIADDLCDSFAHAGDEAGVLEFTNGRVTELVDPLELVVAVKVDLPAEVGELSWETGLDEADGAVIDTFLRLDGGNGGLVSDGCNGFWLAGGSAR